MVVTQLASKFRLYPNKDQRIFLAKTFGCTRAIWNKMLADKIHHYEATGTMLKNTPAQYKEDFPWLKEVDSLALANAQINLQKAYKRFFDKSEFGFPKFKKKSHAQSYTTNNQNGTIALSNGKIKLPKIGWIRVKQHREIKGTIKSAAVSITSKGDYYVSVLYEVEITPLPKTVSAVGIVRGLENFALLSTGEKIGNERFFQKETKKLAKEQRILSRKAKVAKKQGRKLSESKNYQKQRVKVAKIHARIANRRKDFLNKVSTEIIKNHDTICMEDLSSKNLMTNHRLAKSIGDVSWSSFVRMLEYKVKWYGRTVSKISPWYPSSQICSDCGTSSGKNHSQ